MSLLLTDSDSDSDYRDPTDDEPEPDDSDPSNCHQQQTRQSLATENNAINIERDIDELISMSPYFSIVGMSPSQYRPLVRPSPHYI
jgi:hypothetical protein